jgi:spermidine/putrescine-binding protein
MLGVDRSALGAALPYKGFDSQSTDPGQLEQARDAILAIKPDILAFKVTGLGQSLLNHESDLVLANNYEIAAAMQSDPNIGFVTPDDGTVGYVEGIIGVAQTDVPDVSRAFMDFMIQPASYADFVNTTKSARTSNAADSLIDKSLLDSVLELPANAQMLKFLGTDGTSAVSRAWSGVQAN